jgi:hypothetical protein
MTSAISLGKYFTAHATFWPGSRESMRRVSCCGTPSRRSRGPSKRSTNCAQPWQSSRNGHTYVNGQRGDVKGLAADLARRMTSIPCGCRPQPAPTIPRIPRIPTASPQRPILGIVGIVGTGLGLGLKTA